MILKESVSFKYKMTSTGVSESPLSETFLLIHYICLLPSVNGSPYTVCQKSDKLNPFLAAMVLKPESITDYET